MQVPSEAGVAVCVDDNRSFFSLPFRTGVCIVDGQSVYAMDWLVSLGQGTRNTGFLVTEAIHINAQGLRGMINPFPQRTRPSGPMISVGGMKNPLVDQSAWSHIVWLVAAAFRSHR